MPMQMNARFNTGTALGRLRVMRAGGNVKRYHTARMNSVQTVASHSWGVAVIITHIYPEASAALLRMALQHDVSECWTGDLPAPTKWAYPELGEIEKRISTDFNKSFDIEETLSGKEYEILKWADSFELALWVYEDYCMGNTYAGFILGIIIEHMELHAPPTSLAEKTYSEFKHRLSRYQPGEFNDWFA